MALKGFKMTLSNDILLCVRNCADEKKIKMFKAVAKAGNATLLALVDDIHTISKTAVRSEKGVGFALLQNFFPNLNKTIKEKQQQLTSLEASLYPMTPEKGVTYEGSVKIVQVNNEN
jgi:hypothetical protein